MSKRQVSAPPAADADADLEDLIGETTAAAIHNGAEVGDDERVPLVAKAAVAAAGSPFSVRGGEGIRPHLQTSAAVQPPVHPQHAMPHNGNHSNISNNKSGLYSSSSSSATGFSYHPEQASCFQYVTAYISLCCYYHPWVCSALAASVGLFLLLTLANVVFNPVHDYGHTYHDHSNIRSKYDLNMSQIDHWCLGGGNLNCLCEDPLTPTSQLNRKAWVTAYVQNRRTVRTYAEDPYVKGMELDVAFVGESLVEMMDGKWLGRYRPQLAPHRHTFAAHFQPDSGVKGAKHQGIALGIAGDTAPNVLYRLMHGEMVPQFEPKVWWLVLGMNDLARMRCSEEVVVIGILRVVEEILEARPNARIVLNSLLPMEYSRGGPVALLHDFEDVAQQRKDAFQRHKGITGNDEKDGWRRLRHQRVLRKKKTKSGNVLTQGGGGPRPKGPATQTLSPEAEAEEDEQREQAFEEEVLKREGKRVRGHTDAVLDSEHHTTREYNPLSVFTKKKQPPLWTSIYAINRELKKFADHQPRVDYFDATSIFASSLGGSKYRLQSSRIDARGHPTAAGFRAWEDAMVRKLEDVLSALRVDHPEIFSPLDMGGDDDDERSFSSANDTDYESWPLGDDFDIPEMYLPHGPSNHSLDDPQGSSHGTSEGGNDGDSADQGGDVTDGVSSDGSSGADPINEGDSSSEHAPDDEGDATPSDSAHDAAPKEGEDGGTGDRGAEDHPEEESKPNPDDGGDSSTPSDGGSEGGESPNETPPAEGNDARDSDGAAQEGVGGGDSDGDGDGGDAPIDAGTGDVGPVEEGAGSDGNGDGGGEGEEGDGVGSASSPGDADGGDGDVGGGGDAAASDGTPTEN